jgi:hypothetical protein
MIPLEVNTPRISEPLTRPCERFSSVHPSPHKWERELVSFCLRFELV